MALIKLRKNKIMCQLIKDNEIIATVEISTNNPQSSCFLRILAIQDIKISRSNIDETEALPILFVRESSEGHR